MTVLLFFLALLLLGVLIALTSVTPHRSRYSEFELRRRKSAGESAVAMDDKREAAYIDIISLQRVFQAIALVAFVVTALAAFGWFNGLLISVVVSLVYGRIATVDLVHRATQRMYDTHESSVLNFTERYRRYLRWVRTVTPVTASMRLASREELRNLVRQSTGVVTHDESALIEASLSFEDKRVSDIMTP